MLLLKLKAYPLVVNIIQVYAQTAQKLETLNKLTKYTEVMLIIGALNAKRTNCRSRWK